MIFVASCGTVLFLLSAGVLVLGFVPREGIAEAHAGLEFARAAGSLAAPPPAGARIAHRPQAARRLPIRERLLAGGRFARVHPVLRNIGLGGLCWNFAVFALIAALVPYVLELDPARRCLAQAAHGVALWVAAAGFAASRW